MPYLQDPLARLLGPWSEGLTTSSIAFRVLLAMVLSYIIGRERSVKRHSAGLRTFMLIALASTIAMLLDQAAYAAGGSDGYELAASSVIGAAIICIHSMLHSARNQIRGLTTAAGLWACGMIGLAVGAGQYTMTLLSFLAVYIILSFFPMLETYHKNRSNHFEVHLELTSAKYLVDFVTVIRRLEMTIDEIELNNAYAGSGLSVYSIAISVGSKELKKYKTHLEIIEALSTLDYVYHIEEMKG